MHIAHPHTFDTVVNICPVYLVYLLDDRWIIEHPFNFAWKNLTFKQTGYLIVLESSCFYKKNEESCNTILQGFSLLHLISLYYTLDAYLWAKLQQSEEYILDFQIDDKQLRWTLLEW